MSTVLKQLFAVMKLPGPVPALLKIAAAILAGLTNNPYFPNAAQMIAALSKAIATLDAAETAVKSGTKGTIGTRNAARTALKSQLRAVKEYVQQTADADLDHAEAIITSAGFATRKPTTRNKAPFVAKQGTTSGTVHLVAKAIRGRASYDWEWSADGGKTWTQLPTTLQAKTTLTGVAVGSTPQFRFRVVTKSGVGDWSLATSLFVN